MFRIYADGQLVCSSSLLAESDYAISSNASVELALENKAGSFSFQMLSCHYLYDRLKKYKTVVTVWIDEDCVFIGRVMNFTTTNDGKTVYCEGCLSYFNDSVQYKFERKTVTPRERLNEIIEIHNSQVDGYKQFKVGTVNVLDADISYEFELTAPQDTFSSLTDDLTDRFGGYFHVTEESSVLVLDWLQSYEHICKQPIMFAQNLVTYSENDTEDDIWSILYPTASGSEDQEYFIGSVNGGSNFYELPDRIAVYGRIVKSLSFSDIESDAELLEETKKWIEKHEATPEPTITITTVDLSSIFSDYESFSIGDTITFRLEQNSPIRSLICSKISYDLFKPGVVQLTLGLEPQTLTDVYFNDKNENDDRYQETQDHFSSTDSNVRQNAASSAANRAALDQAQQDIVVNANSITANAKLIQMNADRIEANVKELSLKAYNKDLVWVDEKHTEHFEKVDGEIEGLNESTARLASRITSAEIEINGEEGYMGLKAQTAQLYGDVDRIDGELDEHGEYINSLSVELDSANAEIRLKASQTTVDAQGERISAAEIDINGLKSEISLKADKITLEGYVTMSNFNSLSARIDNLVSGNSSFGSLHASSVTTASLQVSSMSASWKAATVVTGVSIDVDKSSRTVVTSVNHVNGNVTGVGTGTISYCTGASISTDTTTLHYLGT